MNKALETMQAAAPRPVSATTATAAAAPRPAATHQGLLRLHWSPKSPYVRKVMVCAHELGLLDRLELVRSVAAMLKPNDRLMQDNPLSKIPTLVLADGFTLFDSVVICEYLNDLGDGSLFPRQGSDKWQALRWHAFGDGLLDALILWRNEREREVPLQTLIDAFARKTQASLKQLDDEAQALTELPLSIGHVAVGCALGYIDYRFDALNWRATAPRLAEWHAELCKRESFQSTEPIDG
jgi:glutathione S-transferase